MILKKIKILFIYKKMTSEEIKDEANLEEKEEKNDINNNDENNENNNNNNLDFKLLFFSHPSQKDKKKKDFTEYSRIDMKLLNKKRERENKKEENLENENNNKLEEDKNINNNQEEKIENKEKIEEKREVDEKEEKKEDSLENNLPCELIELINQTKNNEPLTVEDFEKYKAYKKLNINVYNK